MRKVKFFPPTLLPTDVLKLEARRDEVQSRKSEVLKLEVRSDGVMNTWYEQSISNATVQK